MICGEYLELKTRRKTVKCYYCDEAYVPLSYCPNGHFVCSTCNHLIEESFEENAVREKREKLKTEYGLLECDGKPGIICYRRDSEHQKVYNQFMENAIEHIMDTILEKIRNLPKDVEGITPKDAESIEKFFLSFYDGL